MRRTVMVGLVLGLLSVQARAQRPEAVTGVQLLDHCTAAVRLLEQQSGTTTEHFEYGFCLAYVLGFGDGMRIGSLKTVVNTVQTNTTAPTTFGGVGVCAPVDVSGEQLVRVVLKYLQQHPELLHEPAADLVWTALHEAFPCHK